jgi:peroxiredoxin
MENYLIFIPIHINLIHHQIKPTVMKRVLLALTFVIFGLQANGQTIIQIILKNDGTHKIDKVDAFDLSQKEIFDANYNDTLYFSFKENEIDCYNFRYHENGTMFRNQIWLDKGNIKIEAHLDATKLVIDTVFNSPAYYEYVKLTKNISRLYQNKDTIALNEMLLGFYKKNIDNRLSFVAGMTYVNLNQNSKPNLSKLKLLTDQQGDRFKAFLLYAPVVEKLNKLLNYNTLDIGSYSFLDRQNGTVKLPKQRQKYYVLDFWFLACAPCVQDHKEIAKSLDLLKKKEVELISISTDKDLKKWTAYLDKNNYNWQNYLETPSTKITETIGISAFPTYVILDNAGKILNTQNSYSAVLDWLEKN